MPPNCFAIYYRNWHRCTWVSSSSAFVAVFVRRGLQLHIGDFTHCPDGKGIVLRVDYHDTPTQIVNVYSLPKGLAKEYWPLLQWQRTHVAPDSQVVLLRGNFECNPRWLVNCVFINTEIGRVLLEFVADMHLHLFVHSMQGPPCAWLCGSARFFHRVAPY